MKAFLLLPLLVLGALVARAVERPNVLFIAVDDLRPELGAYGRAHMKTPNVDRLAARGVVFERAYCQQAVCSPSRASLMTGARPDTTQVWDLVTHFRDAMPDVVTLGQHFKENGYFVKGIGKIFHGGYDDAPSWSTPWENGKAKTFALPESMALKRDSGPQFDVDANGKRRPRWTVPDSEGPAFEAADVPDETFMDGQVALMAQQALRDLKAKGQPFFLAVGFVRPHLPFVAPKKYWDLYDPATIELAANPFRPKDAPPFAMTQGELRAYHGIPDGPLPAELARQLRHGYYASVSYMDAQLGKVLEELDRLGLRENTIVVFWGDHGWKLGEHGGWCKHTNYENDVNAPLIVAAPGVAKAGAHSRALVEFVDVYPTLCDLAGLSKPGHLEGLSFMPVLEQPDRAWKTAAFSQYPRGSKRVPLMGYSMRTDRYRFTVWVRRANHHEIEGLELYDHETDPAENTNVARDPQRAELVHQLMRQWQAGWRGAMPPDLKKS